MPTIAVAHATIAPTNPMMRGRFRILDIKFTVMTIVVEAEMVRVRDHAAANL